MLKDKKTGSFFWKLSLNVYGSTYLLAVPLAVYIGVLCGDVDSDRLYAIFKGILIASAPIVPLGIFFNYRRIMPLLEVLHNTGSSEENIRNTRSKLFREPFSVARSVVIMWLVTPSSAVLIGNFFVPMEFIQYTAVIITILVVCPPAFVYSYFIAEKNISELLLDARRDGVKETHGKGFTLTTKIIISLFSLIWMPILTFGFIIIELSLKLVSFENLIFHVGAITVLLFINLFYIAYLFISSIKGILNFTREGIERLSHGETKESVPVLTGDELSHINSSLNSLMSVLNKIISGIDHEAKSLNSDSRFLADTIGELTHYTQDAASTATEISAAIEELAASSKNIADNSREQDEQIKTVSSFMEIINGEAKRIFFSASEGSDISKIAEEKASEGRSILNETITKIENIEKSTQSIDDSASVIKDIADQVNLLSLNASIEAARAGEFGKGFSVVAEEISKLADKTQRNAEEITRSIGVTLHEVGEGIDAIKTTSIKFAEIISYVEKTSEIVSEISEKAKSQSESSNKIMELFWVMLEMAAANLNSTEEQAITHQEFMESIVKISESVQDIANKVVSVNEMSKTLDERADRLSVEIDYFSL